MLKRNSATRPAARYNRPGEDALYLSVDEASARVAVQKYKAELKSPLVIATYQVERCQLVDLHHESTSELRALASQDWREALAHGEEPASWHVSDQLRAEGAIGLIDPSRKNPEVWHVTLFRWNEEGAPTVNLVGLPTPFIV